jgi:hypothetical protein
VPTFYLTRRINDRQGRMLAIVVVALPNSFFEEFFSAVTKDKPFSILLAREDESPSSPHPWCTTPRCGATSSRWLTCTCRAGTSAKQPYYFMQAHWLGIHRPVRNAPMYLEIGVTDKVYFTEWLESMYP